MPPLHMLNAEQRNHLTSAPISELDVEELPHRRMYEGMTVTHEDDFTIAKYSSLSGVYYVYDQDLTKDDLFFQRNRLTPFGMVRAYREYGKNMWRVDRNGHCEDSFHTAEEALQALIHYYG